jgi:hypothetical protein
MCGMMLKIDDSVIFFSLDFNDNSVLFFVRQTHLNLKMQNYYKWSVFARIIFQMIHKSRNSNKVGTDGFKNYYDFNEIWRRCLWPYQVSHNHLIDLWMSSEGGRPILFWIDFNYRNFVLELTLLRKKDCVTRKCGNTVGHVSFDCESLYFLP